MARKTIDMFAFGATVAVTLAIVDKSDLRFTAMIGSDEVCDYKGLPRKFKNADDFMLAALKVNPAIAGFTVTVDSTGVRTPKIPTDPVATAQAEKGRLEKRKLAVTTRKNDRVAYRASIASWENNARGDLAYAYQQVDAECVALAAIESFLVAQIAAQDAIITP